MLVATRNGLVLAAGWISFVLGVIGAFLPVMPTVPFMILAAYFFSKGSPKLHHWILTRPGFGPAVAAWEQHRTIKRSVKLTAIACIGLSFPVSIYFFLKYTWLKFMLATIGIVVCIYIWTRDEPVG